MAADGALKTRQGDLSSLPADIVANVVLPNSE
jgi:hypothetical protein